MNTLAKSSVAHVQSEPTTRYRKVLSQLPIFVLMLSLALLGVLVVPAKPVLGFMGGALLGGVTFYLIDGVRTRYRGAGSEAID